MNTADENFDPANILAPGIGDLAAYIPGKNEAQLTKQYGIGHWVKLDANENPLGPPPAVARAIADALDGIGRYPDGAGTELRDRLAERHGLDAAQIMLGNGSDEVLLLAARTFAGPAASVVSSAHAFAMYSISARSVGARDISVPAKHYGHDLAAMASAVTDDTRVVFIANPNNPTGTYADSTQLERFMQSVRNDVVVVVDQAYAEYIDRDDYPDCSQWLSRYPNLIVTRTFSKIFGMAALRCGYAISSVEIAELMNRVRSPFNVNSLAQVAACKALEDHAFVAHSRRMNERGRDQLTQGFRALGLDYIDSIGNFVCVDVGATGRAVFDAMLAQGVIVRPVANYGLPNHLRFTVGLEQENATALQVLEKVINERD